MNQEKILAVVVLYKIPLMEAVTIRTLCQAYRDNPKLTDSFFVFVWDNSPQAVSHPQLPIPFLYRHTGENLGVSGAYNRALETAAAEGYPWMLLLDQDTELTAPFLERMLSYGHELLNQPEIGSVVPFVRSDGELVSPRLLRRLNRVTQLDRAFSGILTANGYAINSASLIKVSGLKAIGRYSEEFWLDLSDVYAFQRLREQKMYMYVAGDLEINHSIAGLKNFDTNVAPERYQSFLAAENAYLEIYQTRFENTFQIFRLLLRAIRQYLQYRSKKYAAITWHCLMMKLFFRRQKRLDYWRKVLRHNRQIPSAGNEQVVAPSHSQVQ